MKPIIHTANFWHQNTPYYDYQNSGWHSNYLQVAVTKDQLHQIETRLIQAIGLYKRRLEWLTTESRRIFGVVEERSVTLVLDINNLSPEGFDQYRAAIERLLLEQVSLVAKFNIIR